MGRIDLRKAKEEKKKKIRYRNIAILLSIIIFLTGFASGAFVSSKPFDMLKKEASKVIVNNKPENKKQPKEVEKPKPENPEKEKLEELKDEFVAIMAEKYPQVDCSFAIKNLDTGVYVAHNSKKMNSASIIKLFILETAYTKAQNGELTLTNELNEAMELMITESDNESSTKFIDIFGGHDEETRKIGPENEVNKLIKSRGYKHTELNRKMHDKLPPGGSTGYQNYTCNEDVVEFLEGVYNETLFKVPYNAYTMNLLKNQKRRTKIPAKIVEKYDDVIVANKTGELAQVENDAALIMSDDFNLIFVIFTDNIPRKADDSIDYDLKEEVQETISDLGLKLVEFYKENDFKNTNVKP